MNTAMIRESRLNIRCDLRARQLLDKAAYTHVSVSEFVLSHALASAEQVVQAHESITLTPTDFQAFFAALDTPVFYRENTFRASPSPQPSPWQGERVERVARSMTEW